MIERVARALCAKDGGLQSCEGDSRCRDGDICPYPTLARAAIEAMREPSAEMWEAWRTVNCRVDGEYTLFAGDWGSWLACHRAMIGKALGE